MKCYLVGAGDFTGERLLSPEKEDLVIAVDGGLDSLKKAGIKPCLFVGDSDSAKSECDADICKIELPVAKNYTDMMIAADEAFERGCRVFYVFGGTGGRFDHTLGNIQLVANLTERGCRVYLIGADYYVTAVCNGTITFPESMRGYFSVYAYTEDAKGVTEKNAKYEIEDFSLKNTEPRAISNEFIGKECEISVKEGILLICVESLDGI